MTRKFLWGVIIVLLVMNLTTLAIWMNERNGSSELGGNFTVPLKPNESVATVGNEKILYSDWIKQLEEKYGKKMLKDMIDKEVVFQLAEERGIEISQKLIDRELSLLFTMEGVMTPSEITNKLEVWTEDIRFRFYLEELLTSDISIDEGEIIDYYEEHGNQYEFYESIQLSHILVPDKETAEKVISEIEAGASFASLAREYTMDESTRLEGGYLGYFTDGSDFLPADYYERAIQMDEHSYSDPFLTGNGVAIIYLHRMLPSITFTYDEIKGQIRRELALEEMNQTLSADSLWDLSEVTWIYE